MFFTRPCQYAIWALVYLACHEDKGLCQVQEIAMAESLPAPTLASILKTLGRAGLVKSQRGPSGGFLLARPARDITLYQIMEAVGHINALSRCVVGLEACSDDMPCPVHERMQDVRQRLVACLQSITVGDMAIINTQKKKRMLLEPKK